MRRTGPCIGLLILCFISTVSSTVRAQEKCSADDTEAEKNRCVLTPMSSPFTFQILDTKLHPVKGADGLIHLSYAALVTNTALSLGRNFKAVPVDPDQEFAPTGKNVVTLGSGQDITGLINPLNGKGSTGDDEPEPPPEPQPGPVYVDSLPSGQSGFMYFDLTYCANCDVPTSLSHQLTVDVPENGINTHTALTVPIPVSDDPPVVLQSPLYGKGWFDGNGCCDVVYAHRSALLHLNGAIYPAQQFAIDWVQLNSRGTCCTGDPGELSSWDFYGAPIHAVASGKVFSVIARDLPDQKPGKVENITLDTVPGNAIVQEIGPGLYAMYAHLMPGSIPKGLREGTYLKAGDVIGRLGNSGNSTAPHLHFQVMDRPSSLTAHGLPFVIDHLEVEAHIVGTLDSAQDLYFAGKKLELTTAGQGSFSERMPVSGGIYTFR